MFVIRRADVAEFGEQSLIEFFDSAARRAGTKDLIFAGDWNPESGRELMKESPRSFWLLACAGLIPVTESEALTAILHDGRTIEPVRTRVANVQTFKIEDSIIFMRLQAHRKRPVVPSQAPAAPRVVTIDD